MTTPKSSTLNSPSAVSADQNVSGDQAVPKEAAAAAGSGIEKTSPETNINTALGYQSSLLDQLNQNVISLISVNKDILRSSRMNA